jgi:hypothetical protein
MAYYLSTWAVLPLSYIYIYIYICCNLKHFWTDHIFNEIQRKYFIYSISPPSSAEVKNAWSYTATPPIRLHGVVLS